MSIHRRGDVWHYDFRHAGVRYRGTTGLRREADARKKLEALRRAAALGELGQKSLTVEEASIAWFEAKAKDRKSAKTTGYRLEILLRHIGANTPVSLIDTPEIAAAIQARRYEKTRQGRAPTNSTVNRDIVETLRPVLNYAERVLKQSVRRIAWADLKLKEPRGRDRRFKDTELAAWRAGLPHWHRPVFDFFARYGVRLGEAFFGPDDLDVSAGTVRLRDRKNGGTHYLPLLPEDVRDLAARKGRADAANKGRLANNQITTVWLREMKNGSLQPIRWRGFQSASQRALKKAGIADARPAHDLRHHAASAALRLTGNLVAVKQLLGHEHITSTARYAHVSDDDVRAALGHKTPASNSEPELNTLTKKENLP